MSFAKAVAITPASASYPGNPQVDFTVPTGSTPLGFKARLLTIQVNSAGARAAISFDGVEDHIIAMPGTMTIDLKSEGVSKLWFRDASGSNTIAVTFQR
jgi:hypothetical protein